MGGDMASRDRATADLRSGRRRVARVLPRSAGALLVLALTACAVHSHEGPRTPTVDAQPARAQTIEGAAAVSVVDDWACYSLQTAHGTVELVAGPGGYTEGDARYLLGLEPDPALNVGTTWVVLGEFVTADQVDVERGACPQAERYFVISQGEQEGS